MDDLCLWRMGPLIFGKPWRDAAGRKTDTGRSRWRVWIVNGGCGGDTEENGDLYDGIVQEASMYEMK